MGKHASCVDWQSVISHSAGERFESIRCDQDTLPCDTKFGLEAKEQGLKRKSRSCVYRPCNDSFRLPAGASHWCCGCARGIWPEAETHRRIGDCELVGSSTTSLPPILCEYRSVNCYPGTFGGTAQSGCSRSFAGKYI